MGTEYLFKVDHLKVNYKRLCALDDISFTIYPGDFIALMGENGAGKSTLINALNGILSPSEGDIDFNERFLDRRNPYSSIGFSSQKLIVDWYLNVEDNVRLGGALAGCAGAQLDEAVEKAVGRVGLGRRKQAAAEELSGGQQQRIQIARAIAHKPLLYILDEPTTGLDAELSESFFQFLAEENEMGKSIIVASHDLFLLEKYCNKLLFLDKGRVRYWGGMNDFLGLYAPISQYRIQIRIKGKMERRTQSYRIIAENKMESFSLLDVEPIRGSSLSDVLREMISCYDVISCEPISESALRNFFVHRENRE